MFDVPRYSDENSIEQLIRIFWQFKLSIILTTSVFTLVALYYAISSPDIYRSQVLLAPSAGEKGGKLEALASQYGGLASLAGINLGAGEVDKKVVSFAILQSRKFIADFVQRHDLNVDIYASTGWNRSKNEVIIDSGLYDTKSKVWVRDVPDYKTPEPNRFELYLKFLENFKASVNNDTGLVTISFDHYSPVVAQKVVELIVKDLNDEVRRQDVDEAKRSILYLKQQLENTPLSQLQSVFYQLIEEQTKTIMLANARPEYMFKTIDPAIISDRPFSPARMVIVILGVIIGGMMSVLYVLTRYFLFDNNDS